MSRKWSYFAIGVICNRESGHPHMTIDDLSAYGTTFVKRLLCVAMKNTHKVRAGVPNHYARTAYRRFHGNLRDLGSCFLIIVDYEISQIPWVPISLDVDLLLLLVHCQFACRQHFAGSFAVGREH
jgi:hypothetical protein